MRKSKGRAFHQMKDIHRDILAFVLLSGGCWLFDMFVLVTLTSGAGMKPLPANVISSLAAAAIVYCVAHRRIHSGLQHKVRLRLAFYLCYTFGVIMLASVMLERLHTLFGTVMGVGMWAVIAAKIAVTPPQLLCNFLVSRGVARARFQRRIST